MEDYCFADGFVHNESEEAFERDWVKGFSYYYTACAGEGNDVPEDDMGNFGLVDADYKWITERIVKWAQTLCDGRIVSVLEGGYELSPLSRSVAVHVQALVDA